MTDSPLTDQEIATLRAAGYELDDLIRDGTVFRKEGEIFTATWLEWRAFIAEINRPGAVGGR